MLHGARGLGFYYLVALPWVAFTAWTNMAACTFQAARWRKGRKGKGPHIHISYNIYFILTPLSRHLIARKAQNGILWQAQCSAKNRITMEMEDSLCLRMLKLISLQISTLSLRAPFNSQMSWIHNYVYTWVVCNLKSNSSQKECYFWGLCSQTNKQKSFEPTTSLKYGFSSLLHNPLFHDFKGKKYMTNGCRLFVSKKQEKTSWNSKGRRERRPLGPGGFLTFTSENVNLPV